VKRSPAGPPVDWVEVASFRREEEARLVAGRLEAEGIPAKVYPEWQGGYYGESVTVPVQVLVPQHRVLEAQDVLERVEPG
jgi:Putative prokaryotic signal transducing protein